MSSPNRHEILETVRLAGFDQVGALPLQEAGDARARAWLARGLHGEMAWMERHLPAKEDPARAFPGYSSLVVAALDYGQVARTPEQPEVGNISRYALGRDYHQVLKERLLEASSRLKERFPDLRTRAFVDTGPLNEKLIAERAGLGFCGKNTNLIHQRRGSYLFLGLLLLGVPLKATGPSGKERCGLCSACLAVCPTGALIGPFLLDARLCISYLTIELKGPIPRSLRPLMGNRIFGCDDCQEVCPWNRLARPVPPAPFHPRRGTRERSLQSWLAMGRAEWERIFEGSAVTRTGFTCFMRNVLVAAGNSQEARLLPAVAAFLESPEPLLRGHAAWAVGQLQDPGGAKLLRAALQRESEEEVAAELRQALTELAEPA